MTQLAIKQGSVFWIQMMFQNDDGTPADLTTVTLKSQLRTVTGDLVTTLPIVRTAALGVATIEVDDTTQWPIGTLLGDVKATIGSRPILSDTFGVMVGRGITQ
jgi:hypothetical protein